MSNVRIELLSAPGCPNVEAARRVLAECITELGLDTAVVEHVGRYRSPTVLVNGQDVMGAADEVAGDACRLDVPSHQRVLAALRVSRIHPLTADSLRDAERDGTAARAAALPAPARETHRAVLRAFLATAAHRTPTGSAVRSEPLSGTKASPQLTSADLVHIGADGHVVTAYPFSGTPTGHTVKLDQVTVEAMCAIDALGIPLMTGQDAMITSTDPESGQAIRVERQGDVWLWAPVTAVVVLAEKPECGPAAVCLCPGITFHTSLSAAEVHLTHRPEFRGVVLTQEEAIGIAQRSFGTLLPDLPH